MPNAILHGTKTGHQMAPPPGRFTEQRARRRCLAILMLALSVLLPAAAHAGAYDDFFKALQLDLAQSVKSLLNRGFDPNTVDTARGDPALVYAIRFQAVRTIPVLLASPQINLEARAPNGDTALMVAAYKGEKDIVAALLDKGAEPNRPGWTALHYAAASGSLDIARMLLEKSAYIDASAPNRTTPLMMAAGGGQTAMIKLLIEEGADQTIRNDAGMTARDFAAKFADVRREPSPYP